MEFRGETIATYDNSARELAEYFKGIGPRTRHIDKGLSLLDYPIESPHVVEIGCGDGRDASYITQLTPNYTGFDISKGMLSIARESLPEAHFEHGDAVTFDYPSDTDIVFAFASILHLDREEAGKMFEKVANSLKPGGIFYISTKYRPEYEEELKKDNYGERMFSYYNPESIKALSGERFEVAFQDFETIGNTEWLEIALRKI